MSKIPAPAESIVIARRLLFQHESMIVVTFLDVACNEHLTRQTLREANNISLVEGSVNATHLIAVREISSIELMNFSSVLRPELSPRPCETVLCPKRVNLRFVFTTLVV